MSLLGTRHVAPEVLADLCQGHLDVAGVAKVQAHLEGCQRCRQARARIGAGLSAMGQIAEEQAPDLSWDHIGARVYWGTSSERRAKERGPTPGSVRWRYRLAGASAVVLVAGGLFWGLGRHPTLLVDVPEVDVQAPNLAAARSLATEPGGIPAPEVTPIVGTVVFAQGAVQADGKALDFATPVVAGAQYTTGDGPLVIQFGAESAFRIAPNSTLVIDRLDSKRIALRIDGQVDVDITRRLPGQEFSVIAGPHEVQVRGTAFRVDYVEGELGVQCIRGKVVVTDGDHGVHVPAGQRFQVLRDALNDAALRALPMDAQALEALGQAMHMPMLPVWDPSTALSDSTALLEVEGASELSIAVDGSYVADGAFTLRTSIGEHEVALVDGDGGVGKGRVLRAGAGERARTRLHAPSKPSEAGRAVRKQQLAAAMEDSARTSLCLAPLTKQRLLAGSYLVLDVGVNEDGSQSHLNLLDSNLSPAIQACLRDVVDAQKLQAGSAATFRFRLSY